MRLGLLRSLHALALVASVSHASSGNLYVVSTTAGPDVDFTDLQTAIDAVPSGSTLLVRGEPHASPTIVAKSLVLVADAPGFPLALDQGGGEIRNLAPNQRVLLSGFRWTGVVPSDFSVSSNQGSVWLQDCMFGGTNTYGTLSVTGSASVTMRNCSLSYFHDYDSSAQPSFEVSGSRVDLLGCLVFGGEFGALDPVPGAVLGDGTVLYAQDSRFTGGDSTAAVPGPASPIRMSGTATATLRNCILEPGVGPPGVTAPGVDTAGGGTYVEIAEPRRALYVQGLLRADVPIFSQFYGAPNELALVFVSSTPDNTLMPAYSSLVSIGSPFLFVEAVPLGANGQASHLLMPTLPPGCESSTTYAQAIHVGATVRSGSAAAVTVIPANL